MGENGIAIRMFGDFVITLNGRTVLEKLDQTSKTRHFLEYILLKKDTSITQNEFVDVLWADNRGKSPATALRTLLHRLRSLIEREGIRELENAILTVRGAYMWNPAVRCDIDVFSFERLCGCQKRETLPQKRKELCRQAIELYKGALLPNSAGETWVVKKSVDYHDMYVSTVLDYIALLKEDYDSEEVAEVCRRAIDIELYDERLHLELMMALIRMGRNNEALSQYNIAMKLSDRRAGAVPTTEIRSLYRSIVQSDNDMQADIDKLIEQLNSGTEGSGAFVCQFDIFKDIYNLQKRMSERYNSTMFIGLITAHSSCDTELEPEQTRAAMDRLLETARGCLRRGDTLSRFSASQYVMLLPAVNYDTGRLVMERIKEAFLAEKRDDGILLSCKISPIGIGS